MNNVKDKEFVKNNLKLSKEVKEIEILWGKNGFKHGIIFGINEEIYHAIGQAAEVSGEQITEYKKELIRDPEFGISKEIMVNSWVLRV